MKRFFYSVYTKFIAAALCVACITAGVLTVVGGITDFLALRSPIYHFEPSFENSSYLASVLSGADGVLYRIYSDAVSPDDIGKQLEESLGDPYYADKLDYYIAINGTVYTNCGAESAEELKRARFYRFVARDEHGYVELDAPSSPYQNSMLEEFAEFQTNDVITVCASIKEDYATTCERIWNTQAQQVEQTVITVCGFAALALLLLIYLICTCGKHADGTYASLWVDSIWVEVHLALIGFAAIGATLLCVIPVDEYQSGHLPLYLLRMTVGASASIGSSVILISLLSLIRKIKCARFIQTSIVCRILIWVFRILRSAGKRVFRALKTLRHTVRVMVSKKSSVLFLGFLLIYTALIGLCGIFMFEAPIFFFLAILIFGGVGFVLIHRAQDLDEVKKGAAQIRSGELQYKIPQLKSEDLSALAKDLNDIGDGLEASVSAKLRAERMKTDLITNVSHDLKTPLTSIISYTELLSQVEDLPQEAQDYTAIIAKKSQKLKTLTQDLFEISRVQSGNETFVFETLDAALLVNQTLGEHDSEIKDSGLQFCVKTEKELFFSADGRKLSRVLGNLIDNALKYAMKHTRVFLSACESGGEIVIELKNISAAPMEFDADEITGRFVRGDESRTDGSSGLGLAIAKSYTEACGGRFDIVLDGDLFKAVLRFPVQDRS